MSKGGAKQKFSREQVQNALVEYRGLQTEAARHLGCSPMTISRYIERYPDIREAIREAEERMKDIAESRLFGLLIEGDPSTTRWYLARKARERGYGDKLEHAGSVPVTEQRPTEVKITLVGSNETEN